MLENINSYENLYQQIDEYEQRHPEIAEAMKLFDIAMVRYEKAMYAINGAIVYQSNSATGTDELKGVETTTDGKLEQYSAGDN